MTFDRVEVFSDIGILLGCLIAGLVLVSVATTLCLRSFRLDHPLLGWLAVFLNTGKRERILFVVLLCRLCVAAAFLFESEFMAVPLFAYLLLCIVLYALSGIVKYILFDLCCSVEVVAGFYCLLYLKGEAGRAQAQYGTGLLILFAAVFFFGFLMIQFIFGLLNLRASATTMEAYQQATASEKTLEKKVWLVLGLPIVFAILPAIMFLRVEHIQADGTVYQFVKGKQISYEGGGKIRRGDNGCLLAQDKETIVLDPSVIYFDGEEKLVFSSVCSVVQPTVQLSNRIQPMSILEKSGDSYSVIYDKKTIGLEDFFFFDGKDTYYFPAGTLLEWEDESYLTQSICMVTAKYGQSIVLYDLSERNYREIPAESGYCTALLADRTSVNLSTDIIYRENGQEQMLFMQPSLLTDLE